MISMQCNVFGGADALEDVEASAFPFDPYTM